MSRRRPNWWAVRCAAAYWSLRQPQLDRLAAAELGGHRTPTEARIYYREHEPQCLFRDVLIAQGREYRAEREMSMS